MLLDDKARAFLQKPLIARLSVIDPAGYPHTVPVWFKLDGDDIVMISTRDTRKVSYIAQNPKGAVAVGGDPANSPGYLLKGELSIEEDPGWAWLKKLTYHYEDEATAAKHVKEWSELDMIVIRFKPVRVIKVA